MSGFSFFSHFLKDDSSVAEGIIKAMHDYYNKARILYPGKEEYFYLCMAWAVYAKKHHASQYANYSISFLMGAAVNVVGLSSFLNNPDSIDAFALDIISRENLKLSKEKFVYYESQYNKIMERNIDKIKAFEAGLIANQAVEIFADKRARDLVNEAHQVEGLTEKSF